MGVTGRWRAGASAGLVALMLASEGCASLESIGWRSQVSRSRSVLAATARPHVHVVRSGDTLAAIGERFGVSVDALARANRIADVNQIEVGQLVVIHDHASAATAGAARRRGPRIARCKPALGG